MRRSSSSPRSLLTPCLLLLCLPALAALAAEDELILWVPYDDSEDLARLAEHENESMRFQRLISPLLDKNSLWEPFADELAGFNAADYEGLKPLILERSIPQVQAAVAEGSLSYEQLALFYIYRIREIATDDERYLNAVLRLNPEALSQARALDRSGSGDGSPIRGMPILLKDNIGTEGMPTTAGAQALADNDSGDAFITERLKEAGAIILGKANLSEWAYFFCEECPSGYSALGGQTLNPYGRFEFGTGGSSAGSGAALAANLAMATVGSETSGSILSPASANSAVGLKPTTGALSRSGIVPISATLDTAGPITRSVEDAVILFNAMAGYDRNDRAMPAMTEDFRLLYRQGELDDVRLGALQGFLDNPFYQEALSVLTGEGAVAIELPDPEFESEGFGELLGGEMVRDLALYLNTYGDDDVPIESISSLRDFNRQDMDLRAPYGQELVDMMAELEMSAEDLEALRARLQDGAREALDTMFTEADLDVLLSINNRNAGLAALANYPALTIPMGYEESGRPIGLTLIAPSFSEQRLIDIGARFEALTRARRMPAGYH